MFWLNDYQVSTRIHIYINWEFWSTNKLIMQKSIFQFLTPEGWITLKCMQNTKTDRIYFPAVRCLRWGYSKKWLAYQLTFFWPSRILDSIILYVASVSNMNKPSVNKQGAETRALLELISCSSIQSAFPFSCAKSTHIEAYFFIWSLDYWKLFKNSITWVNLIRNLFKLEILVYILWLANTSSKFRYLPQA
jgi:hypothetical protein